MTDFHEILTFFLLATILASKLAKSAYSPLFVALAFGNGLQYRTSDCKRFIYDDLATSYRHLVNFGPLTPEFKRVKCVHPSSISSLATFAIRQDFAGIRTEFFRGDHYSVLLHLCARGRHCHAARSKSRLCHAFLVCFSFQFEPERQLSYCVVL